VLAACRRKDKAAAKAALKQDVVDEVSKTAWFKGRISIKSTVELPDFNPTKLFDAFVSCIIQACDTDLPLFNK
jgi:hypothetical protein